MPKFQLAQTIRAVEWWEFKLAPLLATMYATAFLLGLSIFDLWPLLALALCALVPCAAYVSVINDVTDLRDDIESGKSNRLVGKSPVLVALLLAGCLVPGLAVGWHWRHDVLLLGLYAASWLAFSFYSLPPLRLKERGSLGVLADASGAHLFPTLLVAVLVFHGSGRPLDVAWCGALAVWALNYGLRGILWHQLSDLEADASIGLGTLPQRYQADALQRLGNFLIFPLELIAFAVLLERTRNLFALGCLVFYACLVYARQRLWGMELVVVAPKPRYRIAMHEYYECLYPTAFLLASAQHYPRDLLILLMQWLLFPRRGLQMLKELSGIAQAVGRKLSR